MKLNVKKLIAATSTTAAAFALSAAFSFTVEALDAPIITGQTDASTSSVSYAWNPVNDATEYATSISYDGGATWVEDTTYSKSESVYSLNPGGSYLVRVAAVRDKWNKDKQQSAWSAPYEVVTAPEIDDYALYTSNSQLAATTNSVGIQWNPANGATGYNIFLEAGGQYYYVATTSVNAYVTPANLLPDTDYTYYVVPFKTSSTGYTAQRDTFYGARITASTLPNKPSSFAVDNWWLNIKDFSLEYPKTSADGYRVRIYDKNNKLIYSSENSPHIINDTLSYGAYRKIKVDAYLNLGNNRVYSEAATKAYIIQPKVGVKQTKGKLKITWNKAQKAQKYEIYVSTNRNGGYKKVATVNKKTTAYTLKKFRGSRIKSNTNYYVIVKPVAKGAISVCEIN